MTDSPQYSRNTCTARPLSNLAVTNYKTSSLKNNYIHLTSRILPPLASSSCEVTGPPPSLATRSTGSVSPSWPSHVSRLTTCHVRIIL